MKRKILIILLAVLMFSCLSLCFVACGHKHQLVHHQAVAESCTTAGSIEYWSCECGRYFADNEGKKEISKDVLIVPATGHDCGVVTYAWSANNSCAATRVCSKDGVCIESEVAVITSTIAQQATATLPELTTFTATFSKDGFEVQTITVQTAPCLDPAQMDTGDWNK